MAKPKQRRQSKQSWLKRRRRVLVVVGIILLACLIGGAAWALASSNFGNLSGSDEKHDNKSPDNSINSPYTSAKQLACIDALPNSLKLGQKLMIAGYSDQLEDEAMVFSSQNLGGVILMDETSAATISLFKKSFTIRPSIATDQEGGTVQRYKSEGLLLGASAMTAQKSPTEAYNAYLKDEIYLKSLGITVNFAPVVDVISASPSPLPGRMYSTNQETVINYASQAIRASIAAGIQPVIKHFPGLGSTTVNTDFGSATTDSLEILKTRDLLPYKNLSELSPSVMVSNAVVPGLTNGQPAIWSRQAIELLRSYGYQNAVVYSDSLTAKAIPGSIDDAAVKAWQAGIDVAVIVQPRQDTDGYTAYISTIINAGEAALQSGELNNQALSESVMRIFAGKGVDACAL